MDLHRCRWSYCFDHLFFLGRYSAISGAPRHSEAATGIPEKSIAVLPFDNLSRDPDNAYFAEGVQDEILTRLAKVADLKVISRTSTQHFKSVPENLPQILIALVYIGLADKTKAIDYLEREYLNHDNIDTAWIRADPMLDPLRGDPRFEALAEKILPAREFGKSDTQL